MGVYYIKEPGFRTFAHTKKKKRKKNQRRNGNYLPKNVLKTWGPCICCSPISLMCCQQLVNNKGSIKPVFKGKGNKYNQTRNFGDIYKHCGFAVDNSLREIGLLMLRKWVAQLLICPKNFNSKILLKSLP